MKKASAREYLERALEGDVFDESDLKTLIASSAEEGLWLDFKDGKLTKDKKKAAAEVRRYVAAFANSDGGLLVIGVSEERPREITGATRPGGKELDVWAGSALAPLAAFLAPTPRAHVVRCGDKEVVVIACSRAPRLVPLYIRATEELHEKR